MAKLLIQKQEKDQPKKKFDAPMAIEEPEMDVFKLMDQYGGNKKQFRYNWSQEKLRKTVCWVKAGIQTRVQDEKRCLLD